jgi:hypothetical protein
VKRLLAALAATLTAAGCGVQPTDPIEGLQSTGAMIYLIQGGTLVPVLRPTRSPADADEIFSLLLTGPSADEREVGLTTEVPKAAEPMQLKGSTVTLAVDPNMLSIPATQQIACSAPAPSPVTLLGNGQSRGPITCPA